MVTIGDLIASYPDATDEEFGAFTKASLHHAAWNRAPRPSDIITPLRPNTALGSLVVFTYCEQPPEGWYRARTYWNKLHAIRQQTMGGILIVGPSNHIERRTWFQYEADAVNATLMSN